MLAVNGRGPLKDLQKATRQAPDGIRYKANCSFPKILIHPTETVRAAGYDDEVARIAATRELRPRQRAIQDCVIFTQPKVLPRFAG